MLSRPLLAQRRWGSWGWAGQRTLPYLHQSWSSTRRFCRAKGERAVMWALWGRGGRGALDRLGPTILARAGPGRPFPVCS